MFSGVITALITPFSDNRIDWTALERLVEYQLGQGVAGFVPCGTTGESATLSHSEHKEVVKGCIRMVGGRVPVIAGAGSNSTEETVELTRWAQQVGANAALLITPYYNKPTAEGLYQHYRKVASQVDLPLVLYNVPGRTGVDLKPDTIVRLTEIPNIVAVKEATADLARASWIRKRCGAGFGLLSGDDATFLPFLAVGGDGVISVSSNIAPAAMVGVWENWRKGNIAAAQELHQRLLELNTLLFCETNPIPVKAAATMLGLCGPEIRLPLTPLSEPQRPGLRSAMERLGLFEALR